MVSIFEGSSIKCWSSVEAKDDNEHHHNSLRKTSSLLPATILQCCYYPRKKVLMEIGPITFKHIIIILNSRVIFCFNWKGHASSSKPRWHQFPVKETFMLSVFYLNVNLQSLKGCSKKTLSTWKKWMNKINIHCLDY